MAQRVNRRLDLHIPAAGLRAVVRCSQVPRWGQTKYGTLRALPRKCLFIHSGSLLHTLRH
jgi:hypothetical protein